MTQWADTRGDLTQRYLACFVVGGFVLHFCFAAYTSFARRCRLLRLRQLKQLAS